MMPLEDEYHDTAGPLLTICLPVYNGEHYLPRVLSALLPQLRQVANSVELVVADDASQDQSEQVCRPFATLGLLRYVRNSPNLGMGPNIARCITTHARGRYVWIWSQHCLIRPRVLPSLVRLLQDTSVDVAYVNFRCASYPEKWPAECPGGYDGPFDYVSGADLDTHILSSWSELISAGTCLCTQTYAHIVNRVRSRQFLLTQQVTKEFGSAVATFTQTTATARVFFNDTVLYVGDPVFTIFNGAQTWGRPRTRGLVYLRALPEVVRIFREQGLGGDKLREAERYASQMAGRVTVELLKSGDIRYALALVIGYLYTFRDQSGCRIEMWRSISGTPWCLPLKALHSLSDLCKKCYLYVFFRCRPARWLHSRGQRRGPRGNSRECL